LGKLLGLDRIPEVGYFRRKIKQITGQAKSDELHTELFHSWREQMPECFFYIVSARKRIFFMHLRI
jgi:hypothetical protein